MAKKAIFKLAAAAILNFKNFNFSHVTVICCSVLNSSKSDDFFTEIYRFNDFQNGGRPPSWSAKFAVFVTRPLLECRSAS